MLRNTKITLINRGEINWRRNRHCCRRCSGCHGLILLFLMHNETSGCWGKVMLLLLRWLWRWYHHDGLGWWRIIGRIAFMVLLLPIVHLHCCWASRNSSTSSSSWKETTSWRWWFGYRDILVTCCCCCSANTSILMSCKPCVSKSSLIKLGELLATYFALKTHDDDNKAL